MPPNLANSIYFGPFLVTPQVFYPVVSLGSFRSNRLQVFYKTSLSFALVNIKPILPGHVLVSPNRRIPRFRDLSLPEVADLFATVHRVSRTIERVYKASALNIAIQDGEDAGQSVPHVHVHIIPRKHADLDQRGGSDAVYRMMDGEEGDIGAHLEEVDKSKTRTMFPDADDQRRPRTEEEMKEEARWLAEEIQKDETKSA